VSPCLHSVFELLECLFPIPVSGRFPHLTNSQIGVDDVGNMYHFYLQFITSFPSKLAGAQGGMGVGTGVGTGYSGYSGVQECCTKGDSLNPKMISQNTIMNTTRCPNSESFKSCLSSSSFDIGFNKW